MKRFALTTAFTTIPLLAVWLVLARPDPAAEPGPRQGCSFPLELERTFTQGLPPSGGGVISDDFYRSIEFSPGQREVKITSSELNPNTGSSEVQTYVYTTSFDITDVSSVPGGRFVYVAGIKTDTTCEDIVEQWKVTGGYEVYESAPTAPIGTPRGPYSGYVVIQGGAYIPQAQRTASPMPSGSGQPPTAPAAPLPQKTELLCGDYGHFEDIMADPENRYLLLRTLADHSIYQMPLVKPYAVSLAFGSAAYPQLDRVQTMSPFDLAGTGRFIWLSEILYGSYPPGAKEAVVLDANNDGIFDSLTTYDFQAWDASPFSESLDWSVPTKIGHSGF